MNKWVEENKDKIRNSSGQEIIGCKTCAYKNSYKETHCQLVCRLCHTIPGLTTCSNYRPEVK